MVPTMTSERKKNYRRVLEQEGCKVHVQPMCDTVPVERKLTIYNRHMLMRQLSSHIWGCIPLPFDICNMRPYDVMDTRPSHVQTVYWHIFTIVSHFSFTFW